jgi:Na+-transporting methylmalonyl-CoA/oxaloacetate decarboxylase gamma subunit
MKLENPFKKDPNAPKEEKFLYTEEQLMARLKFVVGICLAFTLFGIVFVVLYSLVFVTQPMNAISPVDQKFFELIVPIATFLTGTLSGIMLADRTPNGQPQPPKPAAPTAPTLSAPAPAPAPVAPKPPMVSVPPKVAVPPAPLKE